MLLFLANRNDAKDSPYTKGLLLNQIRHFIFDKKNKQFSLYHLVDYIQFVKQNMSTRATYRAEESGIVFAVDLSEGGILGVDRVNECIGIGLQAVFPKNQVYAAAHLLGADGLKEFQAQADSFIDQLPKVISELSQEPITNLKELKLVFYYNLHKNKEEKIKVLNSLKSQLKSGFSCANIINIECLEIASNTSLLVSNQGWEIYRPDYKLPGNRDRIIGRWDHFAAEQSLVPSLDNTGNKLTGIIPEFTNLELIKDTTEIKLGYIVASDKYHELGLGKVINVIYEEGGVLKIEVIFNAGVKEFILKSVSAFFVQEGFRAYQVRNKHTLYSAFTQRFLRDKSKKASSSIDNNAQEEVFPAFSELQLIEGFRIEPGYIVVSDKYAELGVGEIIDITYDGGKFKINVVFNETTKEFTLKNIRTFFIEERFRAYKKKIMFQKNIYEKALEKILEGPEVTDESKKRCKALTEIGPGVEKYIQGVFKDSSIKVAIIPLGSVLKGYAGKDSDIEYAICILNGYVPNITAQEKAKILKKVQSLLNARSEKFEAEQQLDSNPKTIIDLTEGPDSYLDSFHIAGVSHIFLPAAYGDKELIEKIRRDVVSAVMETQYQTPAEIWEYIQEEYFDALAMEGFNILNKPHLQQWLVNQGEKVELIISELRNQGVGTLSVILTARQIRSLCPLLEQLNKRRKEKIGLPSLGEMLTIYGSKEKVVSSGVESNPETNKDRGGIDFGAMPIATQTNAVGDGLCAVPLVSLPKITSSSLIGIPRNDTGILDCPNKSDNDIAAGVSNYSEDIVEWAQIEKLVSSGIMPSTERIKVCLIDFCRNDNFNRYMNRVILCIASALRLEEERANSGDSSLRKILTLIELEKSASQLQSALAGF